MPMSPRTSFHCENTSSACSLSEMDNEFMFYVIIC